MGLFQRETSFMKEKESGFERNSKVRGPSPKKVYNLSAKKPTNVEDDINDDGIASARDQNVSDFNIQPKNLTQFWSRKRLF